VRGETHKAKIVAGTTTQVPTLPQSIAYSLPHVAVWFLFAPLWQVIPGVYAKYFGFTLTSIAYAMLAARLLDAVVDPLIGRASDIYKDRKGSRKLFVAVGGIAYAVCGYFLFVPPPGVHIAYFLGWFLAFVVAWTTFEIPHMAWASELSLDSSGKTRLFAIRVSAGYLGLLLFYAVPLLPVFHTTTITPETLRWSATIAGLLILPLLVICLKVTPDGRAPTRPRSSAQLGLGESASTVLRTVFRNVPLLGFFMLIALVELSNGMWYGMIFIYVDSYLGLGKQFAGMFLLAFLIGIVATPLWYQVSKRLGKNATWGIAAAILLVSYAFTAVLTPEHTTFANLLVLKGLNTVALVCVGLMEPSMLSDVVDYSQWRFRRNNAGLYFSVYIFFVKAIKAIGGALGLAIAGWYGFEPSVPIHTQSSIFGLKLAAALLPCVLVLVSFAFLARVPIDARAHATIRRRLQQLKDRETRDAQTAAGSCREPV